MSSRRKPTWRESSWRELIARLRPAKHPDDVAANCRAEYREQTKRLEKIELQPLADLVWGRRKKKEEKRGRSDSEQ